MQINTPSDFGRALKQGPFAWPGGYPLYFVCSDGEALSFDAARKNASCITNALRDPWDKSGWRVIGAEVNWEDPSLTCAHTGKPIEAAYL
jgi:hypothetical protein